MARQLPLDQALVQAAIKRQDGWVAERPTIPNPVIAVVAHAISAFTHSQLDRLFMQSGAPGDPPPGNKTDKCLDWLRRTNLDPRIDAMNVLGGVLEEFMENDGQFDKSWQAEERVKITNALAKYGLTYQRGSVFSGTGVSVMTRTLDQILKSRDLAALEVEHRRALDAVSSDPPTALTAACAILEALFKVYIQDEALAMPKEQSLKPLWTVVQKHINFDPASVEDDDLKRILGGLSSVVDGIGALRTHAGSAHGRGRKPYKVQARHARLAVNASYTLTTFVLETWERKKARG